MASEKASNQTGNVNTSLTQVKIADYLLGETLGSGTFGKVKGFFLIVRYLPTSSSFFRSALVAQFDSDFLF